MLYSVCCPALCRVRQAIFCCLFVRYRLSYLVALGMSTTRQYDLTMDPIFYVTLGFFALFTTILPGIMGQPNFLPIAQTLALTIFLAIPLRRGRVDRGIQVLIIWLTLQLLFMVVGTLLLPAVFERAIHGGFAYRSALVEWAATGHGLPGWFGKRAMPTAGGPLPVCARVGLCQSLSTGGYVLSRLGEISGISLGSLLSAGLVGLWFLIRALNQFGYAAGRLALEPPLWPALGLWASWRLITFAGYAGFITLLAQPLLNNNWNPNFYLSQHGRLIRMSALLMALGLLLELTLPGLWRTAVASGL